MKYKTLLASLVIAATHVVAKAEIIQGIRWLDSYKEVKELFPNAEFRSVKPAWLTQDQSFFVMSGYGIQGTFRILFDDFRPAFKKMLADKVNDGDFDPNGAMRASAYEPDDVALMVRWVRWVPANPIPIERYKQRYGTPVCSFDDEMETVCRWASVAVDAKMSDDQKYVLHVTTNFTKSEKQEVYLRKYKKIPEFLK